MDRATDLTLNSLPFSNTETKEKKKRMNLQLCMMSLYVSWFNYTLHHDIEHVDRLLTTFTNRILNVCILSMCVWSYKYIVCCGATAKLILFIDYIHLLLLIFSRFFSSFAFVQKNNTRQNCINYRTTNSKSVRQLHWEQFSLSRRRAS